MRKLIILLVALCSMYTTCFAEIAVKVMTKDQILVALQDKTLATIYLTMFNKELLPNPLVLYLEKNGKVAARFGNKLEGGQPQNDQGLWSINANNALCFTWKHWNNGQKDCVYVYNGINSLIFLSSLDGSYNALALKSSIVPGNQVTDQPL